MMTMIMLMMRCNYLTHMTRYFHAKKSIKLQNFFDTTKDAMLSNDEVVKLTIDEVEKHSLKYW